MIYSNGGSATSAATNMELNTSIVYLLSEKIAPFEVIGTTRWPLSYELRV